MCITCFFYYNLNRMEIRTEDFNNMKIESDNVMFYGTYRKKDTVLYIRYVDPDKIWKFDLATVNRVRDVADEYTISLVSDLEQKQLKVHMFEIRQYCENKKYGFHVGDYVSFVDKKQRNRRGIICKIVQKLENNETYNILVDNGTLELGIPQFQVSTVQFFIKQKVLFYGDNKNDFKQGDIEEINDKNEATIKTKNDVYSNISLRDVKHINHFKYEVGSEVYCRTENHYQNYYAGRINAIKSDGSYVVLFINDSLLKCLIPYSYLLPYVDYYEYFISEYVVVKDTQKMVIINEKVDKYHYNVMELETNEYYTVQVTEIAKYPLKVNDFDSVYYCDPSGLYPVVITRIDEKAKVCSGKLKLDQTGFEKIKACHFKKLHV